LFHADGWTDRHDEGKLAFYNFAKAPNKEEKCLKDKYQSS